MAQTPHSLTRKHHFLQVGEDCVMLLQLNILNFQAENGTSVSWFQSKTLLDILKTLHGVVISRQHAGLLVNKKADSKKKYVGFDIVASDEVQIAYTFRPLHVKDTVLMKDPMQKKRSYDSRKRLTGGGYIHWPLFPEKLIATVCPTEITSLVTLSQLTPVRNLSDVSHYFYGVPKNITHSESRKKGNLKKIVGKMAHKKRSKTGRTKTSSLEGQQLTLQFPVGSGRGEGSTKCADLKGNTKLKATFQSINDDECLSLPNDMNTISTKSISTVTPLDPMDECSRESNAGPPVEPENFVRTSNKRDDEMEVGDTCYIEGKASNAILKTALFQEDKNDSQEEKILKEDSSEGRHSGDKKDIVMEIISLDSYGKVDLSSIRSVEELSTTDIKHLVRSMERQIRGIFEGKIECQRHQDYKKGGFARGDLQYRIYTGQFSEEQQDTVMETLTEMFCYKHSRYLDYAMKVLFPETLTRLISLVEGVPSEKVDEMLTRIPQEEEK